MQPDSRIARQIIETLGQSGTPYAKGVSYYNVGNESLLNAIDNYYFKSYLLDGGATFKLVVGDYCSGKSHFLYCIQAGFRPHQLVGMMKQFYPFFALFQTYKLWPCLSVSRPPIYCITPIVAASMPLTPTKICSLNTTSPSA